MPNPFEKYDPQPVEANPFARFDPSPAAAPTQATPATPAIARPSGFVDSAVAGFKRSMPETKSLLYGAGAAAAGAVGADGIRDKALDAYTRIQKEEIAPLQGESSFLGSLRGETSFGDWAGDTLGNFGGQALQSLAAAGAGALVGGVAGTAVPGAGNVAGGVGGAVVGAIARPLVKKAVGKKIAEMVAEGATKRAVGQAALKRAGMIAAPTALNIAQETGTGFTGRAEDAQKSGEQLNQTDAMRAIGYGVPAGLIDTAAEALVASRLLKGSGTSPSIIKRIAGGAAKGAATEGGTEGVQAVLERAGAARDLTGKDAYTDYIENVAAGALGGGVAGGASGVRGEHRPIAEQPVPPELLGLPAPDGTKSYGTIEVGPDGVARKTFPDGVMVVNDLPKAQPTMPGNRADPSSQNQRAGESFDLTPSEQAAANMRMQAQVQRANAKTVLGRAAADATDMQADAVAAVPFDMSGMGATPNDEAPVDGFTRLGAIAKGLNLDPEAIVAAARADVGDDPRYSLDGLDDSILTTYAQSLASTVQPAQAQDGSPSEGAVGFQPTPVQAPSVEAQSGQANPVEGGGLAGESPVVAGDEPALASVPAAGAQAQEVGDDVSVEETRIGLQVDRETRDNLAAALEQGLDPNTGKKIASAGFRQEYETELEMLDGAIATAEDYLRSKGALDEPATAVQAPQGAANPQSSDTPAGPSAATAESSQAASGTSIDGRADSAGQQTTQSLTETTADRAGQMAQTEAPSSPQSSEASVSVPSPQGTPPPDSTQARQAAREANVPADLLAKRDAATERLNAASAVMQQFPTGNMGLTPDAVKATPEWKAAKIELDRATVAARNANAEVVKASKVAKPNASPEANNPEFLHNGWATRNASLGERYAAAKKALDAAEKPLREARYADNNRLPPGYKTIPYPERGMLDGVALQDDEGNDIAYPLTPGEAADRAWKESGRTDRFTNADAREQASAAQLAALRAEVKAAQDAWDANGKSPMGPTREAERLARVGAEQKARDTAAKAARTRAENKAKKPRSAMTSKELREAEKAKSEQPATSQYVKYDEAAKAYGRSVREDGAILKDGKESGLFVREKGKRLRIEDKAGKLTFSGAPTGEALGKFMESFWFAEKVKAKSEQPAATIADSKIPPSAAAKTSKAAKASSKGKADDRAASLASYFKPGNIIKSYSGYDEVLSYRPADGNRSMQVDVHEVRKVNGEWVRVGKPQDARWHSTLPDASELKAGPIDTVPAGDATYTEPRADGQPFPNAPRRGAQGAAATHADPGEAPEAVTPAVIADAAKTADRAPAVSMAEARKVLLAKLDAAIKAAPNEGVLDNPPTTKASKNNGRKAWEVNIGRTLDNGLNVPALTIAESHDGNTYSIGIGGKVLPVGHKDNTLAKEGSLLAARLTAARMQQGADWKPSGTNGKWTFNPVPASDTDMIAIDVPGDGTFKVRNTKERLTAFRKQVESFFKLPKNETPKPESLTVSQATRDKIMAEAETVDDAAPEQPAPSQQQETPDKKGPFDSEKFYAGRAAVVKASREAGNVHLDQVDASVEAMRAYTIFDVHNPAERGVVDTVDNHGNVYVLWDDGRRSFLGPSDLKDYAMAQVPRLDSKGLNALRKRYEKASAAANAASRKQEQERVSSAVGRIEAEVREAKPLLDMAMSGSKAQREAAQEYLDGNIDLAEFKAAMDSKPDTQPAPSAGTPSAAGDARASKDAASEGLESVEEVDSPPRRKRGQPMSDAERDANFRRWSSNAPLVTRDDAMGYAFKTGQKVVVEAIHGTKRPDRIGKGFNAKRATSGPMPYFTSDAVTGSSYATGKNDTSLSYEDQDFGAWFKVKVPGYRNPVSLDRAWYLLPSDVRARIAELAPRVRTDYETGENIELAPNGHANGIGNYDLEIKQSRGNALKALIEGWLSSGTLYNDEQRFMDVLEMAGMPMDSVTFDSPFAEYPALFPVYVRMRKPLVTNDIPQEVVTALNAAAKRDRSRAAQGGADAWDKNTRTLRQWVSDFNSANGDTSYVWTSIPDKVTDVFRSLGYDGIVDMGGKGGGANHRVYIPFSEGQVKGKFNKGNFDDSKRDLLESQEDTAADWLANIEADESRTNGDIDADRLGLRKAVNGLLGKSGLRVEYLRGYAGLPEGLRNAVESRNAMGRKGQTAALYDPATKRVFVFTHVVRTPERAAWNAAHEIAGHDGLRKLLGKRLDEVLELADKNPTVSDLADEIAVQRKLAPAQRLLAVEEALAELAAAVRTGDYGRIQEKYKIAVPEGIRARVAQVVTNFLRRLKELLQNRTGVVFKDADVRALLENAWQAAQGEPTMTVRLPNGVSIMEQVVFHGTPHMIKYRFSLNKIGTGEGAQAYGWGLYFASLREVAEQYRLSLAGKSLMRRGLLGIGSNASAKEAREEIAWADKDARRAGHEILRHMEAGHSLPESTAMAKKEWGNNTFYRDAAFDAAAADIGKSKFYSVGKKGNLYRVDVPEDSDLLDWDKPLIEQPEKVRAAIERGGRYGYGLRMALGRNINATATGQSIYKALSSQLGGPKNASERLLDLGVVGLRYLDGGSRAKGEGSANYVIWDESAIGTPSSALESTDGGSLVGMSDFQERVIAAQDLGDAVRSTRQRLTINGDGTITLHHATSEANASSITSSGELRGNSWLAASKGVAEHHARPKHGGNTVTLAMRVDPRDIEFSTGTGEFYAPNGLVRNESGIWRDAQQSLESTEDQTQSEAFRKWFGKSIVTETGKAGGTPLVVYHGTKGDFDVFGGTRDDGVLRVRSGVPGGSDVGAPGGQFWFTTDPQLAFANGEAGSSVMPVYVRIENPIRRSGYFGMDDFSRPEKFKYFDKSKQEWVTPDGVIGDNGVVVAFRPEQIKSALGNNGNFDPDNPSILESVEPFTLSDNPTAQDARIPGEITLDPLHKLGVKGALQRLKQKFTDLKPAALALVPLQEMDDFSPKDANGQSQQPAVRQYIQLQNNMQAMRNKQYIQYDKVAQDLHTYSTTGAGIRGFFGRAVNQQGRDLFALMHDSTVAGIDPNEQGVRYQTEDKAAKYRELQERYNALPEEGKRLFNETRDAYAKQTELLDSVIEENARRAVEITTNRARRTLEEREREIDEDASLTPAQKAKDKLAARKVYDKAVDDGGVQSKIAALRNMLEANRVPKPYFPLKRYGKYWVSVLKDGKLAAFSKFETAAEQAAFSKSMVEQGYQTRLKYQDDSAQAREMIDPKFVADIEEILTGLPDQVRDDVWQAYLERMPDMSLRKSFIHRKNVPGYHFDALKAFGSSMFHGSAQIARLKYGMEMAEAIDVAKDQANALRESDGDKAQAADMVAGELEKRHAFIMNPTNASWAQKVNGAAFMYSLGANPAHLFLNATQTVMLGVPILGSRYGMGRASKALTKAAGDFAKGKGHLEKSSLTADEQRAFREMQESGLIEKTQANDIAGIGSEGVEYSVIRKKVMDKIGWFMHQSERFNREVTAMAAYRLARAGGKSHDAAVAEATRQVYAIHFDYSNAARARVMQGDLAKALLVFRNYQANMLYRLFRDIHQSLRGESVQVKREARKQLGAIFGMYGLFAGTMGVPFYGLAMALAGAFDDDDDPVTAEQQFVNGTTEFLGPTASKILLRGLPGTLFDVDLTERVGMGNLWFRSPQQELEGRDAYYYWMEQLLGAGVSPIKGMFDGINLAMNGQIQRGIERAAPAALRNPLQSLRMAQEGGVTSLDGDLIKATNGGDLVSKAMGFQPLSVSEQYEKNSELKGADRRLSNRRQRLINRYFLAVQMKDDTAEPLADIQAFNLKNPEYAITRDTFKRSARLSNRNKLMSENGIVMTRRMRRLQERMSSGEEGADE